MRLQHALSALSAAILGAALGLAQAAGGCASIVGADFEDRTLQTCAVCTTTLFGPCSAGCMNGGVCDPQILPAIEDCDTAEVDESCDALSVCQGNMLEAASFGDPSEQQSARVAVDGVGNTLLMVEASGAVNYGAGKISGTGLLNIHLVKLSADWDHLWSIALTGGTDHRIGGIATDADNNILVSGAFAGAMAIGDAPLAGHGDGFFDAFVARLTPSKESDWATAFTGPNHALVTALEVDPEGNIVVLGWFIDSLTIGGTAMTSAGSVDFYVAKLAPDGTALWARSFGSLYEDWPWGLAVGPGGEIAVTGFFQISSAIGDLPLTGDADSYNGFVAALDKDGAPVWSRALTSTEDSRGVDLTIDPEGRVLATGAFAGELDFGTGPLTSGGLADVFLAAYRLTDGEALWSRRYGDAEHQVGIAVEVDERGEVLLAGSAAGIISFGPGTPMPAVDQDPFVVKLAPSTDAGPGEPRWSKRFTGTGAQAALGVAPDTLGNVIVAGTMTDLLTVGETVLDHDGGSDVWAAKLQP
jgi:hypothetical protein